MTTTTTHEPAGADTTRDSIFSRVLVGIDDSPESLEAARQAATLATALPLTLLAVHDLGYTVVGGGIGAPVYLNVSESQEHAAEALERATQELAPIDPFGKIAKGRAWEELLYEINRRNHTLVAVGSHGAGRTKGILIGSTATELVHKAPCSVLVARTPLKEFPSSIVVGVDDSKQGATADAVAHDLAKRFGAKLERCENVRHPASELVEAAIEAELLVVGSRRLQGVKALGSVSERVAHEAKCSVLIVR
jgi:nucleotide-binding universal stress UspA family protein